MDLDKLTRIEIGHESGGDNNGWFLEKVKIKEIADQEKEYVFVCNRCVDHMVIYICLHDSTT